MLDVEAEVYVEGEAVAVVDVDDLAAVLVHGG